jgi:predicted ATPase
LGDRRLKAQALAGRAEIQLVRGEPDLAIREAENALVLHRELHDAVLETEDQRILAVALGIIGKVYVAEDMLREVIDRATEHGRPLLVATAQRDLAQLLARAGKTVAAREVAETARAGFDRLGARVELRKLGGLLEDPAPLVPPIAKPGFGPKTFWSQE